MAILPEGTTVPPWPYLLALFVGVGGVAAALRRRRPAVTDRHVVALAAWMVVGSCLHVLYVLDALPPTVRPLAGTPAVYATVAAVAGAVWLLADRTVPDRAPEALGGVGLAALAPAASAALAAGARRGSLDLFGPAVGLLAAVVAAAVAWAALARVDPAARVTGRVGALAVFGHALDGASTAVGVDLLGFGERTPLSRLVIEFAASLPTAPVIGAGWLFLLVKLAVAAVAVHLLAGYVREEPTEGTLLLGFVAAVGLGPGAYNLLLFAAA